MVTKFGIEHDESVQANRLDARPATIRRSCERSLRNLGMEHVDVFLHHWPDPDTPIADTMGAAKELVDEGKVRFVGVSNYTPEQMVEAAAVLPMVANQVGFHMFDRRHAERRFPACEEHGVGVMAYGSLAHGVLAGQLTADTKLDEEDWRGTGLCLWPAAVSRRSSAAEPGGRGPGASAGEAGRTGPAAIGAALGR